MNDQKSPPASSGSLAPGSPSGEGQPLLLRLRLFPWGLFLLASGALFTLSWCVASSERCLVGKGGWEAGLSALVSLGLFLIFSLAAYWVRHTFHGVRSIAHHPSGEQPKVSLVFCVSTQPHELQQQKNGSLLLQIKNREGEVTANIPLGVKEHSPKRSSAQIIRADIEALDKLPFFWNWQQLLRGLEPHLETVRHIHLIGSAGTGGSHRQLTDCRRLLSCYVDPEKVTFHNDHPAQDFENFRQLADLFDRVIRQDRDTCKVADRDIAIDITGGLKPVSVAGAMATLNNDVAVQYVQTNPPKQAYLYQLLYLAKPEVP